MSSHRNSETKDISIVNSQTEMQMGKTIKKGDNIQYLQSLQFSDFVGPWKGKCPMNPKKYQKPKAVLNLKY